MSTLDGTGTLLRMNLRRDRVLIPVVVLVLAGLAASSAFATVDLYGGDDSGLTSTVAAMNSSPGLVALYGEAHASLGSVAAYKMLGTGAVFVALVTLFLLRRHTRTDEETGREELLAAGVLGRHAPLAAGVLTCLITLAATSVLAAAGFAAAGLPAQGSAAFGAAWFVAGAAFTGIAAVAMQVSQSARTCAAVVGAVMGITYLMRAVGDVAGGGWHVLTWLSPFGWVQQVRPYAGDRWWVVALGLAFACLSLLVAGALRNRRDLGAGLLPDRPGPAHTTMGSPLELAWRLQRGAILGWSLAVLGVGVLLGGLASQVTTMLDSPEAEEMIRSLGGEGALMDAFIAAEFGIIGGVVAGFGIAATLRLTSEETSMRSELALSTATTRRDWMLSHVTMALVGTAVVMLLLGVGASVAHGGTTGDMGDAFGTVLPAALVQILAIWVLVGLTVALYGLGARLALAAWAALVACFALGQFGELLHLPDWVSQASPFTHLPALPGGDVAALPLVVLGVVAAGLLVLGALGFRRRDGG